MIQDLSQTLRAILTQPGLPTELGKALIAFDRPSDPYSPTQTTINLFLYDLRENLELRNNEPVVTTSAGQASIATAPMRLACTYLVTAWPVGGTDLPLQEQQLLSEVLQVLSKYPLIPASFLQGSLAGQDPALPLVALHPDALKNISEFWTSLGNKLKPSLSVTVTISMPMFAPVTAPMVITAQTGLEQIGLPATHVLSLTIGGTVTNAANAPVAGATVTLVELGSTATTDADGRYSLGPMAAGNFTLHVVSGASTKDKSITAPATAGNNYDVQLS
ncbi:MAG: Pvc16 family protein [Acidobacteriia bacterium]|nr:Pvc16 family protein [Terriglobia bacterium]